MAGLTAEVVPALVDGLRNDGWYCRPQFLDTATVAALHADLERLRPQFSAAAVGRARQQQGQVTIRSDETFRSDKTLWLRGASVAQCAFFATMEQLRLALNRQLYLGLFDYEAHYAHYAPGAFYRRHLDTFNSAGDGSDSGAAPAPRRVLSTVCYLNSDWRPEEGGELVLWNRSDCEITRVVPNAGTAVFFLSDELPHEVRPAIRERYSIAGWFRTQGACL